jgi:phosphatidylethanolamine/phosphatidyl-N-methylethanolamine N-methyltransferase
MKTSTAVLKKSKPNRLNPRARARLLLRGIKPAIEDRVRFLAAFIRRPTCVGALGPSSVALAKAMLSGFRLEQSETVIELGPGTGAFTSQILKRIGKGTTFFALELDPEFVRALRRRFPGLVVHNDSAERMADYLTLHGKDKADYIVSGLPWASLPLKVQDNILSSVVRCLRPGGMFTTFGYVHARWFPNALRLKQRLERDFTRVEISQVVWRNFPPAFIYRCSR